MAVLAVRLHALLCGPRSLLCSLSLLSIESLKVSRAWSILYVYIQAAGSLHCPAAMPQHSIWAGIPIPLGTDDRSLPWPASQPAGLTGPSRGEPRKLNTEQNGMERLERGAMRASCWGGQ